MSMQERTFPIYRFKGTHREIGKQFGEACRDLILMHRDSAVRRLEQKQGISRARAFAAAEEYRETVIEHARFFDEEVQGLAEGAGIPLGEAYLLQLRAELATTTVPDDAIDECTTFAALSEATSTGHALIGQNADLPAFYGDISVMVEFEPDDQPAVLMVTPAGQLSYIGINDQGVGTFANFITCDGWRVGFPRYFLSRLALTFDNVEDGITAINSVPRASSRNLIMLDDKGTAADIETTPTRSARLDPVNGLLAHSNHYLASELAEDERADDAFVANSKQRVERMQELLETHHGELNPELVKTIMRDRACLPDAICREPGDQGEHRDVITVASVIAEPSERRMWVAVGPPNRHPYVLHTFSRVAQTAAD